MGADYVQSYTVHADGSILSDITYTTDNKDLTEIPRFGSVITLPASFDNYEYYGRGPIENYVDRKNAAMLGIYESKVQDQYVPYLRPQENGNKTDVRWLTLTDSDASDCKWKRRNPWG